MCHIACMSLLTSRLPHGYRSYECKFYYVMHGFCLFQIIYPSVSGRRSCPGEAMARSEIFLFMTSILQRYKCLPVDKDDLPSTEGVTMGPVHVPPPFKFIALRRT